MVDGSRGVAPLLGLVAAAVTVCLLAGCGPTIAHTVPSSPRLAKTSIVVQPSRFLAQGQRVRVVLRGFPPHVKVFVSECARLTGVAPLGCGNLPAAQPSAARTRRVLVTNGHGVAESTVVVQVVAETGPIEPRPRVARHASALRLRRIWLVANRGRSRRSNDQRTFVRATEALRGTGPYATLHSLRQRTYCAIDTMRLRPRRMSRP